MAGLKEAFDTVAVGCVEEIWACIFRVKEFSIKLSRNKVLIVSGSTNICLSPVSETLGRMQPGVIVIVMKAGTTKSTQGNIERCDENVIQDNACGHEFRFMGLQRLHFGLLLGLRSKYPLSQVFVKLSYPQVTAGQGLLSVYSLFGTEDSPIKPCSRKSSPPSGLFLYPIIATDR
jgi:hypothetical protein